MKETKVHILIQSDPSKEMRNDTKSTQQSGLAIGCLPHFGPVPIMQLKEHPIHFDTAIKLGHKLLARGNGLLKVREAHRTLVLCCQSIRCDHGILDLKQTISHGEQRYTTNDPDLPPIELAVN